jgi:methylated-DNA-[protein]-cysteine S-methyltransferase
MHISTRRVDQIACTARYATPRGEGTISFHDGEPWELTLPGEDPLAGDVPSGVPDSIGVWVTLLERYFAGERVEFPLDVARFAAAHGATVFETAVLRALADVPYGQTVSYGELAARAGRPGAARAAGSVMARNPLPVILPCHRVVHGDGTLGQYGDDPRWKEWLLRLEGAAVPQELGPPR